jgi:hypothetical protein
VCQKLQNKSINSFPSPKRCGFAHIRKVQEIKLGGICRDISAMYSHPVQYMEAVSFRDMNAHEYYIRSTARQRFHVECISRVCGAGRKRNPKIFQSCTRAWARPMKARVQQQQQQGELQAAHRFLPASASRAAININSTARPPITRCTHNCWRIKAARFYILDLCLAPAARGKKRSEKWPCLFLCRAGQGAIHWGGESRGSLTTDFAALWD